MRIVRPPRGNAEHDAPGPERARLPRIITAPRRSSRPEPAPGRPDQAGPTRSGARRRPLRPPPQSERPEVRADPGQTGTAEPPEELLRTVGRETKTEGGAHDQQTEIEHRSP